MFAFTHLIGAWLLGKGSEYFSKKKISYEVWFFLLFGSLLPDVDFLIDWTLGTEFHRTFTHSLLFVVAGFAVVYIVLYLFHHPEKKAAAAALAVGISSHLLLDMIASHGVPLFWPSLIHFSFTHIGYFDPATPSFLNSSPEVLRRAFKMAILDMALGTAWIFWLWWKKKVTF